MCLHLIRINWISLSHFKIFAINYMFLTPTQKFLSYLRADRCFFLCPVGFIYRNKQKWDSQISPENNLFLSSFLSLAPDNDNKHFLYLLHLVGKCFLHIFVPSLHSYIHVIYEHDSEILPWISVPIVWCNGVTNKISVSYENSRDHTITNVMTTFKASFINRAALTTLKCSEQNRSLLRTNFPVKYFNERKNIEKVTGFCW